MSNLIDVTSQTFESEVLKSPMPVIVDFYASWCPPCRALGPILERLANEFEGKIKIVKINSDQEDRLTAKYKVTALPTVVFFEDGQDVGQFAGLPGEQALREHLNKWLDSKSPTA
jgi:thioredoxin